MHDFPPTEQIFALSLTNPKLAAAFGPELRAIHDLVEAIDEKISARLIEAGYENDGSPSQIEAILNGIINRGAKGEPEAVRLGWLNLMWHINLAVHAHVCDPAQVAEVADEIKDDVEEMIVPREMFEEAMSDVGLDFDTRVDGQEPLH